MPGRAVRLSVSVAFMLACALAAPLCASATPPPLTFELGGSQQGVDSPGAMIAADFNHDGRDEILTSNFGGNTLSLFARGANGEIEAPSSLTVGMHPRTPVAVDLNRDGDLDIAVALQTSGNIGILLGDGNGGFGECTTYYAANGVIGLAAGDIDRDGNVDLVSANEGMSSISVLYGDGAGGIDHKTNSVAGAGPGSVAIADLNADGWLDVAVANRDSRDIGIYTNNAGALGVPSFAGINPNSPYEVRAGDMDRDGDIDLVTANVGAEVAVTVFANNGSGTFSPAAAVGEAANLGATSLELGDFDCDGILDVAACWFNLDQVRVYRGDGTGALTESTSALQNVDAPFGILLDDLDGDGLLDMGTATYAGDGQLRTFRNTTVVDRGLGFASASEIGVDPGPRTVDSGDFDRDGNPDLLVATGGIGARVLLGNGAGGVKSSIGLSIGGSIFCARFVDFNRDGWLDVAVSDYTTGRVCYLYNNKVGSFVGFYNTEHGSPVWIDTADVNGDGWPDVAAASYDTASIQLLLNDGTGLLSDETSLLMPAGVSAPNTCNVADVNQDGLADVLATNSTGPGSVSVWLGTGGGAFADPVTVGVGTRPHGIEVADMDTDGRLDLVVPNAGSDTVMVCYGNGTGTQFPVSRTLTVGDEPIGATVADINRDGLPDVVSSNASAAGLSVYLNAGNRTFFQRPDVALPSNSFRGPCVVDFNRDGVPDLIAPMDGTVNIAVIFGAPTATPGTIAGRVTQGSSGLANVRVHVVGMPDVYTNSDGYYSVPLLEPGTYTVEYVKSGYVTRTLENVGAATNKVTTLDVAMQLNPATFYGSVTQKGTTNTLAGVAIEVRNRDTDALVASGSTESDGSFSISGITPDTYTVKFHKDGYIDHVGHNYLIYNGQSAYNPELELAGMIEGVVTRESDGAPLAGVWIQPGALPMVQTDATGHYEVTGAPAGDYTLGFYLAEYVSKYVSPVTVTSGATTTQDVTLAHEPETVAAAIDSPATGTTVVQGTSVTFTGHLASDTFDHTATDSEWRSSIDGLLAEDTATFSTSSLSVGTHTISVRVKCTGGTWSPYATIQLNVVAPTADAATAAIDSPAATTVYVGDAVSFAGHLASDSKSHSAAEYEWRSSIAGTLSSSASFSTSALAAGTHTIYFRVKCAGGIWSADKSVTVTVLKRPVTLSTPKVSGKPTAKKGTTFTGTVLPGHVARVTLEVQRHSRGKYRAYKKYYVTSGAAGSYKYKAKPKKGTYRVRAITAEDAKWLAKTSSWRKVVVK
ncbi:MAG TPA: FG-GAP-like repeat-containing protein [Coriobacteriia bacterium]|nr:FG-GAP-like repeat-containing protein [Coriobacteriia bacterium]